MKMKQIMSAASLTMTIGAVSMFTFAANDDVFQKMATPIIALINSALTPAILLVAALGTIYSVMLGVKLAKAEEQQDREKAKASLKNAIIGFLLIFVLVVALKVGIGPLQAWMASNSPT